MVRVKDEAGSGTEFFHYSGAGMIDTIGQEVIGNLELVIIVSSPEYQRPLLVKAKLELGEGANPRYRFFLIHSPRPILQQVEDLAALSHSHLGRREAVIIELFPLVILPLEINAGRPAQNGSFLPGI